MRRQLGYDVTKRLVCALVLSRLDYCNVILAGLSASTLAPLQRVLCVAARVVLDLKPRDHISCALGCQSVNESCISCVCFLVHKASLGQSPDYITDLLQPVAATSSPSSLRDASRGDYVVGSSIFHRRTESVEPAAD